MKESYRKVIVKPFEIMRWRGKKKYQGKKKNKDH
jgi:hypothetical protein